MISIEWKILKKLKKEDEEILVNKEFPNTQLALQYLSKKSIGEKVVVKINENVNGYKEKNIKNNIQKLNSQILNLQIKIKKEEYSRIKKLKFKACPSCGSKINTEFLKNVDCLICKKPILSKKSKSKLLELINKMKVEENMLATVQKETPKIQYLIGKIKKRS